jgi:hypothetical protein
MPSTATVGAPDPLGAKLFPLMVICVRPLFSVTLSITGKQNKFEQAVASVTGHNMNRAGTAANSRSSLFRSLPDIAPPRPQLARTLFF